MSLVIGMQEYDVLMGLRGRIAAAVAADSPEETHRTTGMLQGYLIGLHTAGTIDAMDVKTLEIEALENINFLLNARKVSHAN